MKNIWQPCGEFKPYQHQMDFKTSKVILSVYQTTWISLSKKWRILFLTPTNFHVKKSKILRNHLICPYLEKRKFSVKYRNLLDLGSGGLRCLALSTSTLICSRSNCTRMLTLPKGNSCMAFCSRCLSHKYLNKCT